MTERDPRSDPQLGDVWRFIGEGYPFTMFLCRKPEGDGKGWWGLDLYPGEGGYLETPRVTDFGDMPDEDWEFVEYIDGHAIGGLMIGPEASIAVHHIDGNSANNDPANLIELPWPAIPGSVKVYP